SDRRNRGELRAPTAPSARAASSAPVFMLPVAGDPEACSQSMLGCGGTGTSHRDVPTLRRPPGKPAGTRGRGSCHDTRKCRDKGETRELRRHTSWPTVCVTSEPMPTEASSTKPDAVCEVVDTHPRHLRR